MNYIYGARLAKKKQKKQHIHENFGNYINSQYLADHFSFSMFGCMSRYEN
jgi:hypothetical protein